MNFDVDRFHKKSRFHFDIFYGTPGMQLKILIYVMHYGGGLALVGITTMTTNLEVMKLATGMAGWFVCCGLSDEAVNYY